MSGDRACLADEFFPDRTGNPRPRRAYGRSGGRFLARFTSLIGCLALLTPVAWAQLQTSYRIDTFAGRRVLEDGGPATQARIARPEGVAVDGAGNLYIADSSNDRIRKVDSTGTITTVAGTGELGFSGDGGAATQATLAAPYGVAVDSTGNFYFTDTGNHRIRKVDSTGTITAVAGTGERGDSGDSGPATQAQIDSPTGRSGGQHGQPLLCRYRQRPDPQGRLHRDDHDRCGRDGFRIFPEWRPGDSGAAQLSHRRGGGRSGQPLYRRQKQPPHPQGRFRGDGYDRGGDTEGECSRRRRRSGVASDALLAQRRGGGRSGQPLHRRYRQRPHPQDRFHRDDHDRGGGRGARFRWRRRTGEPSADQLSHRRGGGRGGPPLHRRQEQQPRPQGRLHRDDHDRGGHGGIRFQRR